MEMRVYLRHLELSDAERVYQWHNDFELYSTLTSAFHPVSLHTVEEWIKRTASYSDKEINYAICLSATSEHIGNIYMREIDYISRNGFLGAFIGNPENRNKGYVREAVIQIVEYAYGTLGLKRLYMHCIADNAPAIHLLQKCGFVVEGTMRQHIFKNGEFKDVLVLGMCQPDYAQSKEKLQNE